MKLIKNKYLLLIILLATVVRFYKLGEVPVGFHHDEVSQAYNAFAIGTTGHDRYGEYFPILFRSFGSYQPPVYTYLAPIPILLFGNSIFAARFISALSGLVIVFMTYLIVNSLENIKHKRELALMSSFVVAISPWAIHFSRIVVEGNLGLAVFLISFYLLLKSLKKPSIFIAAMLVMGLSTHAYYSERLISILFIPAFLLYYRQYFFKYKKIVVVGLVVFALTQIPHIWIVATGAYARRFDQVSYVNNDPGSMPRILFLMLEFFKHYISYLSPPNLFAATSADLGRVAPDLGVFYTWFFAPFLIGLAYIFRKYNFLKIALFVILMPFSLVPAGLTGDLFYPLRALEYLWLITLIISVGFYASYYYLRNYRLQILFIFVTIIYSLTTFYVSYFVLFQYESTEHVGASYLKLNQFLESHPNDQILLDTGRDFAAGLRIAYLRGYDADKLAEVLRPQLTSDYYSSDVGVEETYIIDNVVFRRIVWREDVCKDLIIIGDTLAISDDQANEHSLDLIEEIEGSRGEVFLRAFKTNPEARCN